MTIQPQLDLVTPLRKSSYSKGDDNCVEVDLPATDRSLFGIPRGLTCPYTPERGPRS
jgi:hypothetical protein